MFLYNSLFKKKKQAQVEEPSAIELASYEKTVPLDAIPVDIWLSVLMLLNVRDIQIFLLVNKFANLLTKNPKVDHILFRKALEQRDFPEVLIEQWTAMFASNPNNNNNNTLTVRELFLRTHYADAYYKEYNSHLFKFNHRSLLDKLVHLKHPLAQFELGLPNPYSKESLVHWRKALENCELIPYSKDSAIYASKITTNLKGIAKKLLKEADKNINRVKTDSFHALAIYELILDFSHLISDLGVVIDEINCLKRGIQDKSTSFFTKASDWLTIGGETDASIYRSIIQECDRVLNAYEKRPKPTLGRGMPG